MTWTTASTSRYQYWNLTSTTASGNWQYISGTDWYTRLPQLPSELYEQKPTIPLESLLGMWSDFQVVLIKTEEKDEQIIRQYNINSQQFLENYGRHLGLVVVTDRANRVVAHQIFNISMR